jgi:hypothetical protein
MGMATDHHQKQELVWDTYDDGSEKDVAIANWGKKKERSEEG